MGLIIGLILIVDFYFAVGSEVISPIASEVVFFTTIMAQIALFLGVGSIIRIM
jgi:hypothetical protein